MRILASFDLRDASYLLMPVFLLTAFVLATAVSSGSVADGLSGGHNGYEERPTRSGWPADLTAPGRRDGASRTDPVETYTTSKAATPAPDAYQLLAATPNTPHRSYTPASFCRAPILIVSHPRFGIARPHPAASPRPLSCW